ncbi:MAG: phage tail sheath C-terminal domain-containing protein [Saprospiraceae bacterium]|nr:phage tail sheath C-terminal domain-containing protein [Saprospiraceae bacterium]
MLNLSTLKTPGVYIDEVALLPPSVAGVETSIPAFIGYTEKAEDKIPGDLILVPKKIKSLKEYEQHFGRVAEKGIAVTINDTTDAADKLLTRQISVAVTPAKRNMYYQMQMFFANGGSVCYVVSVGEGSSETAPDLGKLEDGLNEIKKVDEPTLIVFPDVHNGTTEANVYNLYKKALAQAGELQDRFVVMDVNTVATFRSGIGTENLKYGAAYYPSLKTFLSFVFNDADVTVDHQVVKAGAAAVAGAYDGNLSLVPKSNALYGEIKQKIDQTNLVLTPSSAVVGVYAAVDASRGVWKAPANVSLTNVLAPTVLINDLDQRDLNVDVDGGHSINVIRHITGRGPAVIWGARTLAGNDNEWRYVSVRRFFNFVEESVKKATYRFVFEPNDANTWVKVRAMIENFLTLQWRAGALMGAKPEHAFFVRVGLGQTMTQDDVLNGRLIIEIGMAAVRPAEFIVLRFMHKLPES